MKYTKHIFLIIVGFGAMLLIYLIGNLNNADYCDYCSQQNYSIFGDDNIDLIFLSCAGSVETLEIRIIDPVTSDLLKVIQIDGLLEGVVSIDNGNTILAIVSETDGLEGTHDGKLVKIDYDSGNYLDEYEFTSRWPLAMVVDSLDEYVYVTAGLIHEYEETPPQIYKFNISDFSLEASSVCGEHAQDIEISNDNSKLYLNDGGVQVRYDYDGFSVSNTEYYYNMSVRQTSNLDVNTKIESFHPMQMMEMGYDNRLYVGYNGPENDTDYALLVIDTQSDQIIESLRFGPEGKEGINFLECDPVGHNLYCTTFEYGYYDPDLEAIDYATSMTLLKINLDDYSSEFLIVGNEPLWQLAVAYDQDFCRVFSISETSKKVYYIDQ